jgi:NAD(P)-dependent dehydrogenase (short-subunit alcohol dehydrogenase family)
MILNDKVAVVTGCARGLGFAIAKKFSESGAHVIGIDKELPNSGESYELFQAKSSGAKNTDFFQTDISDSSSVKTVVGKIKEKFTRIDVLVNNAGVHIVGNIEDISEENFRKSLDINVWGTFLVTKYLVPLMKDLPGDSASIVNIASNLGIMGAKNRVAYPTTKAAIVNFTRCMAMDYAEHNIRVNAVAPGAILTKMTINFFKEVNDPEFEKENKAMHIMNRFAQPEEIAEAVLFLASGKSSYCTGSVLSIDGGYTCGK